MKISPYFLSAFVVLSASFAFAGSDGDSSFMPSKDRDKTGSNEVSTPDDRTKPTDSGERNLTIVLWAFHPGSGYVRGKTFAEADQYCRSSNGRLASKMQLVHANEKGLSLCAYGWLADGAVGFVMRGKHAGCGNDGWNSAGYPQQIREFGTYCVGPDAPRDVPDRYKFQITQ